MTDPLPFNPYVIDADTAETQDMRLLASALHAIAYEQHTANLIAVHNARFEADGETDSFIGERIDAYALARIITARLDLDGGRS